MSQPINFVVEIGNLGERKKYRIIDKSYSGDLGSKFFGRWTYTLVDEEGNKWKCYGKRVSWNSKLFSA